MLDEFGKCECRGRAEETGQNAVTSCQHPGPTPTATPQKWPKSSLDGRPA
jgi:hypothetical protein